MTEPKTLTPARLAEIRELLDLQLHESFPEDRFYGNQEMADLFQHIDALTAEVAALDRDYGELLKSMTAELQEARAERDALQKERDDFIGWLDAHESPQLIPDVREALRGKLPR